MSIYYIKPQDSSDRVALDATMTVQLDESGKTTTLPLESGEEVTDHYINANTKISMAGIISTAKSASSSRNKTPEDYIRVVRELKQSGKPFSVYFSDKLEPLTSCVFENLSISQSKRNGSSGSSSSYKISFSVKQVRFIQAAQVVVERAGRVTSDSMTGKKTSGKSTQEPASVRNIAVGGLSIKAGETLIDASGVF